MIDPKQYKQLLDDIARKLVDDGKLIEAGWIAMRINVMPPDAPDTQVKEMRRAYLSGAQHVFASMMQILDSDLEPTENDIRRFASISKELKGRVKR